MTADPSEGAAGIRYVAHMRGGVTFNLATEPETHDAYHRLVAETAAWTHVQDCLLSLVRPGDTVIDAGANIGAVTIPLAVQGINVIAYESLARNVRFLEAAAAANGVEDRVTIREVALWESPGVLAFTGNSAWGRVSAEGADRIEATTIDRDLPAGTVVRAVKLDVEGAEQHVLRGMRQLIRSQKPDIVFEANSLELGRLGSSIAELFRFLEGFGYRIYRLYDARRLLLPSRLQPEISVADFLATARWMLPLRMTTRQRIGLLRPRHIVKRILDRSEEMWADHIHLTLVADRLPARVWDNPEAAARLARWRETYRDHALRETIRHGIFGRAEKPSHTS